MKKYVKPMMESEAFVANEYIGACWFIECGCTKSQNITFLTSGSSSEEALSNWRTEGIYPLSNDGTDFIYDGYVGNVRGCFDNDEHNNSDRVSAINYVIRIINWLIPGTRYDFAYLPNEGLTGPHHHMSMVKTNKTNNPKAPNAS